MAVECQRGRQAAAMPRRQTEQAGHPAVFVHLKTSKCSSGGRRTASGQIHMQDSTRDVSRAEPTPLCRLDEGLVLGLNPAPPIPTPYKEWGDDW